MVNSERNLTLLRQSIPPAGAGPAGLAADLPGRRAAGLRRAVRLRVQRARSSTRSAGSPTRGPATTCAASATSGCGETPMQWPCRRATAGGDDDRHPIRYLNDGVSQDLFVDEDGDRPRLAFPTPSRRAVFFAAPAHGRPRNARRRLPDGAQHRSAAAPMAHHDQDRQGRQAQQTQPRAVRRDPSRSTRRPWASSTGSRVEIASRRGRAVLPAVVTDRVRPGNCFAPFHWNDEHGEYLTINAVTNDAVDPESLQPEFKVCAVSLRPVGRYPAGHRSSPTLGRSQPTDRRREALPGRVSRRPERSPAMPVLPATPRCVRRAAVGRRCAGRELFACRGTPRRPAPPRTAGAVGVADRQRRGVRGRVAGRLAVRDCVSMDDVA